MIKYILFVYPILFFIMIFGGCKLAKRGEFMDAAWSRQQTLMLQAMACVGVVLHHVTQMITAYGEINKGPITIFSNIGFLFTAIFFFFSGYGLVISLRTKSDYLDNFMKHRMPIILVPFFATNAIYVLVCIFYKKLPLSIGQILQCIFGYLVIDGNAWFIVEIFILYILFYLLCKHIRKQELALFLLSVACVILMFIGLKSGHDDNPIGGHWMKGEWWYNSTIAFIMGLWIARFKDNVQNFMKNNYKWLLPVAFLLLLIVYPVEEVVRIRYGYYFGGPSGRYFQSAALTLVVQSLLCICFVWLVLLLNLKISIGNPVLKGISIISMDIYLIHGVFVKNLIDRTSMNDAVVYVVVLACGIVAAAVLHVILQPVIHLWQGLGNTSNQELNEYERKRRQENRGRRVRIGILSLIIILILTALGFLIYTRAIRPKGECRKELEQLSEAEVGDEVCFGRYETNVFRPGAEHVPWIVLAKDENGVMLVSKEGLTGSVYYQKHTEIKWADSDICHLLNDILYDDMFSGYEKAVIVDNPDSGDRLSLLTVEEAEKFFSDDVSRQLAITDVALREGTNINSPSKANYWDMKGYRSSWWWLRGEGDADIMAPIVSVDGVILTDEKYVNKPNGAVRPVVWIGL